MSSTRPGPETRRGLQDAGVPAQPREAGRSRQASPRQLQAEGAPPGLPGACEMLITASASDRPWSPATEMGRASPGGTITFPKEATSSPGLGEGQMPVGG